MRNDTTHKMAGVVEASKDVQERRLYWNEEGWRGGGEHEGEKT